MLTRPKLIEPFQVVLMGNESLREGVTRFVFPGPAPANRI